MDKRVKIILAVSVVLNLLFISAAGGMAVKNAMDSPWSKQKKELSPETRNIVGRVLQSSFREIRPLGDEARKERAELIKIITADEFDGDQFDKIVGRLVDVKSKIAKKKIEATKSLAEQLPLDAREKMAERMIDVIGGGREHHVRRHRKPMEIKPAHKPEELDQE